MLLFEASDCLLFETLHDKTTVSSSASTAAAGCLLLPHLLVSFDVLVKMVAAHEPFVALAAHESLFAGVCPEVSLQFVRSSETFAAIQPVADERSLSRVPANVGTEVRGLSVDLRAVRIVTDVLFLPWRSVRIGGF